MGFRLQATDTKGNLSIHKNTRTYEFRVHGFQNLMRTVAFLYKENKSFFKAFSSFKFMAERY